METDDLKLLCMRLKQGDYDGTDIMQAWIAIGELIELRARVVKLEARGKTMESKYAELTKIAQYLKQLGNPTDAELVIDAARALQNANVIADSVANIVPSKFVEGICNTIGNAAVEIRGFKNKCTHEWDKPDGTEANCTKCGCYRMGNEWSLS